MNNIHKISRCAAIFSVLVFSLPFSAAAASIYFDTVSGPVSTGDTVVIRAYLDTGSSPVNAVDGTLTLDASPSSVSVSQISVAGSAFTLWPRTPSLSPDGKTITFTGGIPNGIEENDALLFTVVFTPHTPGNVEIQPGTVTAYLNDGKGTALPVTGQSFHLAIGATQPGAALRDEWQEITGTDTIPPLPFTIELGQDPSIGNGQKFITFQTSDAQSGIAYYEVKEGDKEPVMSGTTYVLQNQNTPETITVYAYDKAGNVRTSEYQVGGGPDTTPFIAAGILAIILLAIIIWRSRRKRRYS